MALLGNPQDVLSTPYGYSGQMAPETAVAEQQLNRRRLIANMLMQNGMQRPQGGMVGRFFVGANPLEHVANLAQAGLGAYLTNRIDDQSKDLMAKDRKMVDDFLAADQEKFNPQYQNPAQSMGIPPGMARIADAMSSRMTPTPDPTSQTLPPRPDGPYNGEVGAAAMPEVGVQSDTPPTDRPPAANAMLPQGNPAGVSMNVTPGDMNQFLPPQGSPPPSASLDEQIPSGGQFADSRRAPMQGPMMAAPPPQATPEQPLPPPAPAPTPPAPPVRFVEPPAPPKRTMQDLAALMTHQHPQVRAYGQFLAQQMQQEKAREDQQKFLSQEKDMQREFMKGENALNRDTQRELVGSKLDQAMMMGLISKEQKDQMMAQAERQNQLAAEIKKAEIGSRTMTAKQHDETLKAIAQMNMEGRKEIAGMKANPANRPMSPTAQKELIQTEEEMQGSHQAIQHLKSALAINDKAMGFSGAGALASAASLLPDAMRPKSVDATVDLDNLITGSALPQLKAIFGGMPTEGERKVLLDVQGSSSKTPQQREAIFKRAIQSAENRLKFSGQKAEQLRSGKYFSGDGGIDTTAAPNPGMGSPPSASGGASKNAKGWVLHTDANGNKAYVSPDGKQFEEVK